MGCLQRRLDLPDATVLVLQGIAFMVISRPRRCMAGSALSSRASSRK